jgi:hypothetical protein
MTLVLLLSRARFFKRDMVEDFRFELGLQKAHFSKRRRQNGSALIA